jgi:hypothetical protein
MKRVINDVDMESWLPFLPEHSWTHFPESFSVRWGHMTKYCQKNVTKEKYTASG